MGAARRSLRTSAKVAKAPKADDDIVHAGDGDDIIYGNAGNDELHGEAGNDLISGGKGNDVLFGGDGADNLNGNSGDDVLYGGAGNDVVNGSSGNDVVVAGEGDDVYTGGSGFDTLDFSEASGSMMIDVSKKTAVGAGSDTFSGFESYIGSGFADTLKGSSQANALDGGAGSDVLRGMAGADTLTGGQGNDTFQWLAKDIVSGGAHQGVDVVTDFTEGDMLDLHDMLKKFKGNFEDHVRLTENAQGSVLSVDIGGTFHDVALSACVWVDPGLMKQKGGTYFAYRLSFASSDPAFTLLLRPRQSRGLWTAAVALSTSPLSTALVSSAAPANSARRSGTIHIV